MSGETKVKWAKRTHGRGLDEEPSRNPANGEADELSGHDDHPLVPEIELLPVKDALDGDDVGSVGRPGADTSHDGNEDMLLRERA